MSKQTIPVVAYVIVCWNNRDILEECIESINSQTYPNRKVIVVDNGSSDDSVAFLNKKYSTSVEVIETRKNNGFSIANNIGIKQALMDKDCQYIALINTDARIDPKWTSDLVSFAEKRKRVACMQTPTLDYYDHSIYDSFGTTIDRLGRPTQIGYRTKKHPSKSQRVFGVNFAAAIVSRDFIDAQPFDDYLDKDIWMYIDDIDFAARTAIMGWQNWLVETGARAYHMGSASSGKNPGFSVFMSYRNHLYMLVKNMPFLILARLLMATIAADAVEYYRLVRGKNWRAIKAIVRGRFMSLFHLGVFFKKRKGLMKLRSVSNKELWDLMDPKSFSMSD